MSSADFHGQILLCVFLAAEALQITESSDLDPKEIESQIKWGTRRHSARRAKCTKHEIFWARFCFVYGMVTAYQHWVFLRVDGQPACLLVLCRYWIIDRLVLICIYLYYLNLYHKHLLMCLSCVWENRTKTFCNPALLCRKRSGDLRGSKKICVGVLLDRLILCTGGRRW